VGVVAYGEEASGFGEAKDELDDEDSGESEEEGSVGLPVSPCDPGDG
jgi:hypothetical protein